MSHVSHTPGPVTNVTNVSNNHSEAKCSKTKTNKHRFKPCKLEQQINKIIMMFILILFKNLPPDGTTILKDFNINVFEISVVVLPRKWFQIKRGAPFLMVVVSILPHAEFGRNDYRKDAPRFI